MRPPAVRVISPGNQVDGLPGVVSGELSSMERVIRKLFQPSKGPSGPRLSVILGRNFDSLEMFLITTWTEILQKIKDILKIMLRDDVNA